MPVHPATAGTTAILVLAVVALAAAGRGDGPLPGPIPAELIRVVDGDTVDVRARIWLGQAVETRVRIAGVDAPELRGGCDAEKAVARRARERLETILASGPVALHEVRFGKFAGRVVARVVTASGVDPAPLLVAEGLARAYDGDARDPWCAARQ